MKKIFLISQPRSGSSLLQHILGTHPDIFTFPESWVLLPLIYSRKDKGMNAEYQAQYAFRNITNFINLLPNKEADYWDCTNRYIESLYNKISENNKYKYILDKCPRYYHIVDEIIDFIPNSKIIILLRNPLAVLSSIINYNFNGDWKKLLNNDRIHDLITAPKKLLNAISRNSNQLFILHYENLVSQPKSEIHDLFKFLEIPFNNKSIYYKNLFKDNFGKDKKSLNFHNKPVLNYVDSWIENFHNPTLNTLGRLYLDKLGEPILTELGYPQHDLLNKLPYIKKNSSFAQFFTKKKNVILNHSFFDL